jgi:formyl-CoA transferase
MVRLYQTKDGRWISICLLQDRWWPDLARRIGRADLLEDERFATEESKYTYAAPLTEALDQTFATKTLAEWIEILRDAEGVWAPLFAPQDIMEDEQALVNGFVVNVTADDGFSYKSAAGPGQFDERPVGELHAAPAFGQHTDQVLSEIGFSQGELAELRGVGAIA